jgi:hypothetical protein
MRIDQTQLVFAWQRLEDQPTLKTIRHFLQAVPDKKLMHSLRAHRGHGRNDCPVNTAWGVLLLTIALRHPHIEATLGELRRNPHLARLIEIENEADVPKAWNISRFLKVLGQEPHFSLLVEVFDQIIQALGEVVSDLGADTAGDSASLSARKVRAQKQDQQAAEEGLPEPAGGRKEYTDESGKVVKVYQWFGYKLHILVDRRHEVAVAYKITSTKKGDGEVLPELVRHARRNLPKNRMQTLAYDKAADDSKVHQFLHAEQIKPVIQIRKMWKDESEKLLPGHDGTSNVVHDEAGTVYCYDKVSGPPIKHKMSYNGYEQARGTIKYRCPAAAEGWSCPSHERCNAGKRYGKTVRIKCEQDLRRFPPIPRATKKFERLYRERTSVERVIGRLKIFWGADDGNVSGACRFHALLGTVMVVHAAFAMLLGSAPRGRGTLGTMHLSRIAEALRQRRQNW